MFRLKLCASGSDGGSGLEQLYIRSYDENANEFTMVLKDWHARIAQHEMDHLDGKFFTDSMIRETMFCTCWKEVNDYEGKITLPFAP